MDKQSEIDNNKNLIRKKFLQVRKNLTASEKNIKNSAICQHLLSLFDLTEKRCFGVYQSDGLEADLDLFISESLKGGNRIFSPRYNSVKMIYEMVEIFNPDSDLEVGKYKLLQPRAELEAAEPEWVKENLIFLTPGVAFDAAGVRLGRGKGFYDRLLEGVKKPVIGIFFACQECEKLPAAAHDRPMDIIVTEHKIYRINQEKQTT